MRFALSRSCRSVATAAGLCLALTAIAGCVEISGQRLAISHDAERDTITMLVFYDGVYDNPGRWQEVDGATQLRQFIPGGEVLLFDWPFHFAPDEMREAIDDETQPAGYREFAAAWLESVKVESLGWHRDAHGRIGGVQRLTITDAARFIRALNRGIDALVFEIADESTRTGRRLREAASRGHEWVRFAGGSLRVDIPMHPGDAAMALAAAMRPDSMPDEETHVATIFAVAALSNAIGSANLTDAGLRITALGDGRATLLRLWIPDRTYQANLEDVVMEIAPRDLGEAIVMHMRGVRNDRTIADLIALAPREFIVMAIVHRYEGADADERAELHRLTERYVAGWAEQSPVPLPEEQPDDELWLDEWRSWSARMELFPLSAVQ